MDKSIMDCVIWDIYGTMLYNDLETSPDDPGNYIIFKKGFEKLNKIFGYKISPEVGEKKYKSLIKRLHKKKVKKNPKIVSPEIDIVKLWEMFFKEETGKTINEKKAKKIAITFEKEVNPVSIGENIEEVLEFINYKKLFQGILSNAQFYTKLILSEQLNKSYNRYFEKRLTIFSYKKGVSKPDPIIYDQLERQLKKEGIPINKTIVIGNDLKNDIYSTAKRGFKTIYISKTIEDNEYPHYHARNDIELLNVLQCIL